MKNEKTSTDFNTVFSHPFVIVLGIIIIFYGGYIFGKWFFSVLN